MTGGLSLCISALLYQILEAPTHSALILNREVAAISKNSLQLLPMLALPQQAAPMPSVTPERTGPGPSCPPNPPAGWIPRGGQWRSR